MSDVVWPSYNRCWWNSSPPTRLLAEGSLRDSQDHSERHTRLQGASRIQAAGAPPRSDLQAGWRPWSWKHGGSDDARLTQRPRALIHSCLLYTSDAADD